jgi:tetratricopeptide (TPR) repeat protein
MTANPPVQATYHIEIHQAYSPVIGDSAQMTQLYGDAEAQRRRVEAGVAAERATQEEARFARAAGTATRVVGVKPDAGRYFVDREREREQIGALLAEPSTHLITLVGQGGMGKTALACKALDDLLQQRRDHDRGWKPVDGIVYMSTRTAGISLERVFQDCARMLGDEAGRQLLAAWTNPELSLQAKVAQLLEVLSDGRFVVLLDNLDDLLDAEGRLTDQGLQFFLEQSLRSGQGAALLATARRELGLIFDVQALVDQLRLDAGLPVPEGVVLLRKLDRRGRLRGLTDDELAQAVVAVHGVPRALQLIPSLLASQPVGTGLSETMRRFYGSAEVVRALIEENYRRLTLGARQVMDALAVFRRPVPAVAVDYLLEPFAPGLNAPTLVKELVAWSIVSEDYRSGMISLHPADQDYAYSQLPDEEMGATGYTRQSLERRAAEYHRELRTQEETWRTIDDLVPYLAEFEHWTQAAEYDEACRVVDQIGAVLHLWGHYERIVQMRMQLASRIQDQSLSCGNLRYLGTTYRSLGLIEKSVEFYELALEVARLSGETEVIADALSGLGLAQRHLGHHQRAIEYFREALELAQATQNEARIGSLLGHLGTVYYGQGKTEQAHQLYEESLAIARQSGSRNREVKRLNSLGNIVRQHGDLDKALEYYNKALQLAEELGHERGRGNNLDSIAGVYLVQRRWESARATYLLALEIARNVGQRRAESHRLIMLGKVALGVGQVSMATQFCNEALQLAMAENDHVALLVLGICYLHARDSRCRATFDQAIAECQELQKHSPDTHWFRYNLATACVGKASDLEIAGKDNLAQQALSEAMEHYTRALNISSAKGVLQHVLLDLELIQAAGAKGLKPVVAMLERHLRVDEATHEVGLN